MKNIHQWIGTSYIRLLIIGLFIIVLFTFLLFRGNSELSAIDVARMSILLLIGIALIIKSLDLALSSNEIPLIMSNSNSSRMRKWINVLGGINFGFFTFYSISSYGLSPLAPLDGSDPSRILFHNRLADKIGILGPGTQEFLRGHSALAQREVWLLVYCSPVIIASIVFLILFSFIANNREQLIPEIPKILFSWAVVFALVFSLAIPVLVLDFWYPVAWGKMIVDGINPYYSDIPLEYLRDLPLGIGRTGVRMMYGPLWAAGYGFLMWIVGGLPALGVLLLKLLVAAAWIGSLWLIWSMLRKESVWHQSAGILLFGWLPVGLMQAVGDGHNDILMVFFLLLWIRNLHMDRPVSASVALAASLLIKYVTAPLFLLDILHHIFISKKRPIEYWKRAIPAAILIVVVFALFMRSLEFFEYLPRTSSWHFYSPKEALITFLQLFGIHLNLTGRFVRLFFLALSLYYILKFTLQPNFRTHHLAVLAVMTAMLFGVSSHFWPWYILWVLGVAALLPVTGMTRWLVGVSLITPFPILIWVAYPEIGDYYIFWLPSLLLYTVSTLWYLFVPQHWFQGKSSKEHRRSAF